MLRPLVAQDQCLDQDNLQWQNCLHAGKTDQFSSGSFSCLPGLFLLWLYLHLSIMSDALGALWFLCKTIGSSEAGCKIRTIGISLAPPRFETPDSFCQCNISCSVALTLQSVEGASALFDMKLFVS